MSYYKKDKVKDVKKPVTKKRKVFYITYVGLHKHLRVWGVSGMSRVVPGKRYEVSEKISNSFRTDKDWKVEMNLER